MALESMQEIFDKIEKTNKPFWRVVLDTDMEEREVTEAASMERMRFTWQAMLNRWRATRANAGPSAAWWAVWWA